MDIWPIFINYIPDLHQLLSKRINSIIKNILTVKNKSFFWIRQNLRLSIQSRLAIPLGLCLSSLIYNYENTKAYNIIHLRHQLKKEQEHDINQAAIKNQRIKID